MTTTGARHTRSTSEKGLSDKEQRPRPSPKEESTSSKANLPRVNLAVVGARGVGKSTFVQCALDLPRPPASRSSAKKMSLEGTLYIVNLWELSATEISITKEQQIVWPRLDGDEEASYPVDGALLLYNATSPQSVVDIAPLLRAVIESGTPFELVACKSDIADFYNLPERSAVEQAIRILRQFDVQETSSQDPRSQKRCISLVLRSMIAQTSDRAHLRLGGDNPDSSNSSVESPSPGSASVSAANPGTGRRRRRAGSEVVTTSSKHFSKPSGEIGETRGPSASHREVDGTGAHRVPSDEKVGPIVALNPPGSRYGRSNSQPVRPRTPPSGTRISSYTPSSPDLATVSPRRQNALRTTWRHSAGSDAFNSFLDMEEETEESRSRPASADQAKGRHYDTAPSDPGVTFDDLVDRLVALPMSKQDTRFVAIFLCLYRKFAAPSRLLNTLIARFDHTERSSMPQLTRASEQLRLLQVIAQWASDYPGDFAYPRTRRRLLDFVLAIEKNHVYMFAAKEIILHLENHIDDDDIGWPYRDGDGDEPDESETFLHTSARSSPSTFITQTSFSENLIHSISSLDLTEDPSESSSRHSGTLSHSSSAGRSGTTLTQSSSAIAALEEAQRQALGLELTPKYSLGKPQWRQFMEIPDDEFARELTRIDWVMFTSFRPRDLVRHVSLSGQEKETTRSLENVNRMIKEFNHLAFFVASMILLRDKPKHRARAMEKLMNIALRLRRQNNYNSLGAVIAGLNGTPVQRLMQTRELIPHAVQKEFMRLVILMGTQKSHFAYRLAWENSFGERIPFLPLHRRDLVSAEEGNKTFVGDNKERINWKKFDIMGDVVLGIQRSQRTSYSYLQKNEEVQRLVLDTKMRDEEDLYSRSMQVEPSAGGVDNRKMWGWLRT